jgi:hypothetical protein
VLATKPNVTVTIEGKVLKQTDKFKYLGGEQVADGSSSSEIRRRISIAHAAFKTHKNMLHCNSFTRVKNGILYNIHVLPALLYGSETWTVRPQERKGLKTMHLTHLLTMACKSRKDHISHAKL